MKNTRLQSLLKSHLGHEASNDNTPATIYVTVELFRKARNGISSRSYTNTVPENAPEKDMENLALTTSARLLTMAIEPYDKHSPLPYEKASIAVEWSTGKISFTRHLHMRVPDLSNKKNCESFGRDVLERLREKIVTIRDFSLYCLNRAYH